jgi:hypothetical protein
MQPRALCVCLLVFVTLHVTPALGQGVGLAAGANFDQLSDIDITEGGRAAFDSRTGWHVEAWFDLPLGPVGLRPGVRYMDAGQLYDGLRDDEGANIGDDISINMIEVPLHLRYTFGGGAALSPYVTAGPVLRFPLADEDDFNDDLETVSVAGGLGAGIALNLGGIRVYPEIGYTFGITRLVDEDFSVGGIDFQADDEQYLNSVLLRIGVGL